MLCETQIWTLNLLQIVLEQTLRLVDIFCLWSYKVWTIRLVREMANPLLHSFGEPPRILATNSNSPPIDLKKKGNTDLPSVCSNYWPPIAALSLTLTIWYFWPFYEKLRYVVKTYHCVVDNPHLLLVLLSSSLFPQFDQRHTEGAVFLQKKNTSYFLNVILHK